MARTTSFIPPPVRGSTSTKTRDGLHAALPKSVFIRLSANRTYLRDQAKTPAEACQLLAQLLSHPNHRYLEEPAAPVTFPEFKRIFDHQAVTDAYLVAMARLSRTKFVTFDRSIASLGTGWLFGNSSSLKIRRFRHCYLIIIPYISVPIMALDNTTDVIEVEGQGSSRFCPARCFRVELDNSKHVVLAHISGKMRKRFIRLTPGDRVKMEMSQHDLTQGAHRLPSRLQVVSAPGQ